MLKQATRKKWIEPNPLDTIFWENPLITDIDRTLKIILLLTTFNNMPVYCIIYKQNTHGILPKLYTTPKYQYTTY